MKSRLQISGKCTGIGLHRPILQNLEIVVRCHQALHTDVLRSQFHHGPFIPGSIRFLHTHADQRQFTVGTLHINAGTFGLYHKAGFLQAVLVLVEYGGRNLNQAFRLFKQGLVPVSQGFHLVGGEDEHVQVNITGK